jgi:subtilisin family serine protease
MRGSNIRGCLAACAALLVLPVADALAAAKERAIQSVQLVVPKKKKPKEKAAAPKRLPPRLVAPKAPNGPTKPREPDRPTKPKVPDRTRPEIAKPDRPPRIPPRIAFPQQGPERERYLTSLPHRNQRASPRAQAPLEQAVARQLVVLIGQDQPTTVEADLAGQFGLEQVGTQVIPLLGARSALYRIRDRRPEQQVIAAIAADGRVQQVQLNYRYRPESGPAGAGSRFTQYGHLKVELPGAHLLAQGRDVVVAVIDSAVDVSHPDLQGAVVRSFDAAGGPDKTPDFHGTAVAGIIRARGVLEGVAPQSSLLAICAFQVTRPGEMPETSSWVLLKAIDWAVANDAKVLNLSFTGPRDPAVHRILQAAAQRRVVTVAAAGNGGPKAAPAYPAAYPEVIAVTALDERDRLYQHANRGGYIAVAAPGVDILAPVEKGKHSYLSGTSFAAAYVSGIVALLLERDPGLEPGSIADLIFTGALDLGPKGRDDQFGAGRINALQSLQAVTRLSAEKR